MLSGAITYQLFSKRALRAIDKVKAMLEKHPFNKEQCNPQFQHLSVAD
jgi:ribosomal protein L31E